MLSLRASDAGRDVRAERPCVRDSRLCKEPDLLGYVTRANGVLPGRGDGSWGIASEIRTRHFVFGSRRT
jgi:hypothetical protein